VRFRFKNLGYIDNGEIEIGNLTVICGPNNAGKTYISYSIFGFLQAFGDFFDFEVRQDIFDELYDRGFCRIDLVEYEKAMPRVLKRASQRYAKNLHNVFNTGEDFFKGFEFEALIDSGAVSYKEPFERTMLSKQKEVLKVVKEPDSKIMTVSFLGEDKRDFFDRGVVEKILNESMAKVLAGNHLLRPFVITSERTGISLFYKELDITKNVLIEQFKKFDKSREINPFEIMEKAISRYPISIKHNIDHTRDYDRTARVKSFLLKESSESVKQLFRLWEKITMGNFKMVNNEILYIPKKEKGREQVSPLPVYMSSSAVKSLTMLDMYVRHIAGKGDILLIDEPELNLYPGNQSMMARFLARLVNMGINILITTHSDYLIKEFNNLIMLSNEFPRKNRFMKQYEYSEDEILDKTKVRVYSVSPGHSIQEAKIDKFGIALDALDDIIVNINRIADELYLGIDEE
jgi:predicted ATPase